MAEGEAVSCQVVMHPLLRKFVEEMVGQGAQFTAVVVHIEALRRWLEPFGHTAEIDEGGVVHVMEKNEANRAASEIERLST